MWVLFWIIVLLNFINFLDSFLGFVFIFYCMVGKNWIWESLFKIKRIIFLFYILFNDTQNVRSKFY